MTKQEILDEIRRAAAANGGKPLGMQAFLKETGIRPEDWRGRYWARWGDAVRDAGLVPNALQGKRDEEQVIQRLMEVIREQGRLPTIPELALKRRRDATFPSHSVFGRRLGSTQSQIASTVLRYCERHPGFDDVAAICRQRAASSADPAAARKNDVGLTLGAVYLFKVGRHYKIGRSNAVGRRERELAIQLPDKGTTVHSIQTDDPVGIEAYWHRRFEAKRGNGEWFALDAADITAFKRRRFM